MKKTVKLVSAMLILVMLMAQVVCINAASAKPTISYSTEQIDHFEKTCTVTLKNVKDVDYIWIASYKADKTTKIDEATKHVLSGDKNVSSVALALDVRPNDAQYIHCTVHLKDGSVIDKWYAVGGNSYYNPGAGSGSNGYYDGLIGADGYWSGPAPDGNGNVTIWKDDGTYESKEEWKATQYETYYVTCRKLNVRNGAGTWADRVGSLKRYTKVKVYDIENNWAVIEYEGHLRFVSAKYLSK